MDETCVVCGRTSDRGFRLTEDLEWICRNEMACIDRVSSQLDAELPSGYASAERVRAAIDRDYEQRRRR